MIIVSRFLTVSLSMIACLVLVPGQAGAASETVLLWPDVPELSQRNQMGETSGREKTRVRDVGTPHLIMHLAKDVSKPAPMVIVCPPGGYEKLVPSTVEPIAAWLNEQGVHVVMLYYRCPTDRYEGAALPDLQRAIRVVRANARKWKVNPQQVGVLGASSGGNLAVRASIFHATNAYGAKGAIDKLSARPDFTILLYPSWLAHRKEERLEKWVTIPADVPPTVIFTAKDDEHYLSSTIYEAELRKAGNDVTGHYYESGGHEFSLPAVGAVAPWPDQCLEWMRGQQLLP